MMKRLFPDLYVNSVYELPLAELKKKGIRGLVFDIDNTIAPFDMAEPDESVIALFEFLRKEGFRLCILSNNNKERVQLFSRNLKVLAIHRAGKPGTGRLRAAMKRLELSPESTAIVGDQVFTDIWCGHRAGVYCIMTAPVCERDQLVTRVKRGLERQVMKQYWKRVAKKHV